MPGEAAVGMVDMVMAGLVECQGEAPPVAVAVVPPVAPETPVQASQAATVEQTGADPPPGR